ncbi:Aste57867_13188 [Aphanomyces stellatus]|uniref:Aste57867_13188 protein n=1 Tax=Aphanomyces stellatus TaxID=120398 RepID=A0A485KZ61_9STRA|nr:hypothetical protein As57867_013139 [Aphanomyces stellatus]VFT90029.1 Aste57867_13188 [Aphanomyces stellatus]
MQASSVLVASPVDELVRLHMNTAGVATRLHVDEDMLAAEEDDEEDDSWEMPLLFMTNLPPNFKDNLDVAAISTFSADYEEESSDDEARKSPPKAGKVVEKGKYRAHSRKLSNPYAKSRKANVAELQVCLKLFNM